MLSFPFAATLALQARRCAVVLSVLALSACTIEFSPGDAKPAGYTPYGFPGGYGDWWDGTETRNSAGTPPR